jgi:hypothetical protein
MEDPARNRLRTMLGELLDHMEGAQEVASGIAQKYPEYEAPLITELPRAFILGNTASQLATPSGAPSSCRSGTPP